MVEKKVSVVVKAKNALKAGLARAGASLKKFGQSVKRIGGLFVKGFAIAGAAITAFSAKVVKMQARAAIGQAKLAAVLKSTGFAAGKTAAQLNEEAAALSELTDVEDDAITHAQALIATFKEIKGDTFTRTTKAALDMTAVMEEGEITTAGLKAASIQLGKALNDPIKGLGALSRVGIQFTAQQKEQIAAMVKSNDVLGAQNIILTEVESQFGGAAEAAAKADFGIGKLTTTIGEAGESMGLAIAEAVGLEGILEKVRNKVKAFGEAVERWVAGGGIVRAIATWKLFFEGIRHGFAKFSNAAHIALAAIVDGFQSQMPKLKAAALTVFAAVVPSPTNIKRAWAAIKDAAAKSSDVVSKRTEAALAEREAERMRHAERVKEIAEAQAKAQAAQAEKAAKDASSAEVKAQTAYTEFVEDSTKKIAEARKKEARLAKELAREISDEKKKAINEEIQKLEQAQAKRKEIAGKTVADILSEVKARKRAEEQKVRDAKKAERIRAKMERGIVVGKGQLAFLTAFEEIEAARGGLKGGAAAIQDAQERLRILNAQKRSLDDIKTELEQTRNDLKELLTRR